MVKRDVTVGQAGANETQRRHRRGRRAEPSLRVELEAGAPRHLEAAHTQTFEHTVGQRFDARAFQIDVVDRQALDVTPAKRCDERGFGLETRRLGDPSGTASQVTFLDITSLTRTATDRTEQFRSRGIRVVIRVLQRGEDIRQNPSLAVQRVAQVEPRFRPFHPVARVDRCRSGTAGAAGALPVAIDLGLDGSSYRISICQSVLRVIYRSHHRLRTRRVTNRRCRRGRSVGVEISVDQALIELYPVQVGKRSEPIRVDMTKQVLPAQLDRRELRCRTRSARRRVEETGKRILSDVRVLQPVVADLQLFHLRRIVPSEPFPTRRQPSVAPRRTEDLNAVQNEGAIWYGTDRVAADVQMGKIP